MRAFPTVQIHFQLDWHAFYRSMFAEPRIEPTNCQCRVQHLKHVECISVTCPLMPHVLIFVIKYIFKKKERKEELANNVPQVINEETHIIPFPTKPFIVPNNPFLPGQHVHSHSLRRGCSWHLVFDIRCYPLHRLTVKTMPKDFRCDDTRLCGAFMTQFAMTFIGLSFIFLMVPKIAFCFTVVLMLPPTGSSFKTLIHDY